MMANGLGPWWFPEPLRRALTWASGFFFDEAAWDIHDEGYARGEPSRAICDWKFFQAMLRDASRVSRFHRVVACLVLAFTFYFAVRAFGWGSYNYRPSLTE